MPWKTELIHFQRSQGPREASSSGVLPPPTSEWQLFSHSPPHPALPIKTGRGDPGGIASSLTGSCLSLGFVVQAILAQSCMDHNSGSVWSWFEAHLRPRIPSQFSEFMEPEPLGQRGGSLCSFLLRPSCRWVKSLVPSHLPELSSGWSRGWKIGRSPRKMMPEKGWEEAGL